MTQPKDMFLNMALFMDGTSYIGNVDNIDPPKLTATTEEFRGGGMNGPVEITTGHEALRFGAEVINYSEEVFALFSLAEGSTKSFTIRGALKSWNNSTKPIKWNCRGKVIEIDPQNVKPGTPPRAKLTVALDYMQLTIGTTVVQEIDVINMTQIINGVDVLYDVANALGIR